MEPQAGGSSVGGWSSIPAGPPNPSIDATIHQSLASHFHLLHLVENLAEAIESGTRDQHSDALTVEGQKRKVDECQQLLNQCRDLISHYKNCVEDLIKSDTKKA